MHIQIPVQPIISPLTHTLLLSQSNTSPCSSLLPNHIHMRAARSGWFEWEGSQNLTYKSHNSVIPIQSLLHWHCDAGGGYPTCEWDAGLKPKKAKIWLGWCQTFAKRTIARSSPILQAKKKPSLFDLVSFLSGTECELDSSGFLCCFVLSFLFTLTSEYRFHLFLLFGKDSLVLCIHIKLCWFDSKV